LSPLPRWNRLTTTMDDDWDADDWDADDSALDQKLAAAALKVEPIVDKQAEEDEKKKKEETELAAKRFQDRQLLKEKQAIAKRRLDELKLLEENLTDEDRIEMERLLEDEAAMEMAKDLFDDDSGAKIKSDVEGGGQNLTSATVEDLVKELCSRMKAFDDFGKTAEVLAAEIVAGKPKESNLGHFLKTMLRSSAFKLAPHRVEEVSVVIETIKAEAKAAKDKAGAKVVPTAKGSTKASKKKKKAADQKNQDFGEASLDRFDNYAMDYDGYDDFM